MKTLFVTLATGVILPMALLGHGKTQSDSQKQVTKQYALDKTGKKYDLTKGEPITITISNIGEMGVVALNPATASSEELVVKAYHLNYGSEDNTPPSSLVVESFTSLPDQNVRFTKNRLIIDGGWRPNKRVVVHLTLPSESEVSLMVNGKLVRKGQVGKGLMKRGDEVVEGGKGGLFPTENFAILQAITVGAIKGHTHPLDPEAITPASKDGNEYNVPWKLVKPLAIESVNAKVNSFSVSRPILATIEIRIDQKGNVTSTKPTSGDENIGKEVAQALAQWRFRPYVINSQPINIRSSVFVRLIDGKVVF